MRAVQHSDVTDTLHQDAVRSTAKLFQNGIAFFAISHARAHLHEFMSVQRAVELRDDRGRQARSADQDDGIAGVGKAAQIFLLLLRECALHA